MVSKKRNQAKKTGAEAQQQQDPGHSASQLEDGQLMDDLFTALESRDQESAAVSQASEEVPPEKAEGAAQKRDSKARHLARQARKAAALAQHFSTSNSEADAEKERETKQEAASIKQTCDELGVQIHEINPDGHCLFSAIADQLALLNIVPSSQANYAAVRATAADYMLRHPDDFLPFLPSTFGEDGIGATDDTGLMTSEQFGRYCLSIRDTAKWGGEHEIHALSRAYNIPILVIQGGNPPVVVHTPGDISLDPMDRHLKAARISFHRRVYALGEHYNSLRPKNALSMVTDKLQAMLS